MQSKLFSGVSEAVSYTNIRSYIYQCHNILAKVTYEKKDTVKYSNGMVASYDKTCILYVLSLFIHEITLTWKYNKPLHTKGDCNLLPK